MRQRLAIFIFWILILGKGQAFLSSWDDGKAGSTQPQFAKHSVSLAGNGKRIDMTTKLSRVPPSWHTRNPLTIRSLFPPTRRLTELLTSTTTTTTTTTTGAAVVIPCASSTTYLVRICFLRALAFVHLIAFWIAFRQNKALIGDSGITPARKVLDQAQARGQAKRQRRLAWRKEMQALQQNKAHRGNKRKILKLFSYKSIQQSIGGFMDKYPALIKLREVLWDRSDRNGRPTTTLLWLAKDRNKLNDWLDGVALSGIAVASFILFRGAANVPLVFALWIIQKSLMNVGGLWYSYGWEPQLAELSFHTMFLVPFLCLDPIPLLPLSPLVQWTIKWHLFRIMMGAGLIKLRSNDPKWKDLTTMNYFYETQPVPNPLSRYMHWMPEVWHKFEVLGNHFVELLAPWLLIIPCLPKAIRRAGGIIQVTFQCIIISTGNLSFLNWLTMVPAIMCLDDAVVGRFFSPSRRLGAFVAAGSNNTSWGHKVVELLFFALIAKLSLPVVQNLLSKNQTMNASYDPLRLVNSYGAFGTVGERREEWIISAAADIHDWKEYEFKVKPGSITRSPRFISPYHYRLDWQMWLAANLKYPQRSHWIFTLLYKLLNSDPDVSRLIERDPFADSMERPKYIKIDAYSYSFHKPEKGEKSPPYWKRAFLRQVYPSQGFATLSDVKDLSQSERF